MTAGISMPLLRSIRFVRKSVLCIDTAERRSPRELTGTAARIVLLCQFYYLFIAYRAAAQGLQFDLAYREGPPTHPLWPIKLVQQTIGVDWFAYETEITAVGIVFAISSAIMPRALTWRTGTFLYLLLHVSLSNSYGSINHSQHILLYTSFALLFLPRSRRTGDRAVALEDVPLCLTVLWLVQSFLLLPYTLSGLWKIWYGRLELFESDALTRVLLKRLLTEIEDIPPLLPVLSQHTLLAQAMWLLTLYIEIFALFVVFRPHLHKPFGVLLMLFHITSDWLMNISFSNHILILGIFLVMSPVAPSKFSLSGFVKSLPIIGMPLRSRKRRSPSGQRGAAKAVDRVFLVYDGECPMCNNYAHFLNLKQSVKELILIDARQGGPLVDEIRSLPHDLDDGMVVKIGERYYIGHEALNVLALLSGSHGVFSRINRLVFSSQLTARLGYPWLKLGRRLLLRLKGVASLDGGDAPLPPQLGAGQRSSAADTDNR